MEDNLLFQNGCQCEYCTGKKNFENYDEIDTFYIGIDSDNELEVYIEFGNKDAHYEEYFKINYCPMCGRKL